MMIPLGHDDTNLCFEPLNSRKQIFFPEASLFIKSCFSAEQTRESRRQCWALVDGSDEDGALVLTLRHQDGFARHWGLQLPTSRVPEYVSSPGQPTNHVFVVRNIWSCGTTERWMKRSKMKVLKHTCTCYNYLLAFQTSCIYVHPIRRIQYLCPIYYPITSVRARACLQFGFGTLKARYKFTYFVV